MVSDATPGLVVLRYIREQAEPAIEEQTYKRCSSIASVLIPAPRFRP